MIRYLGTVEQWNAIPKDGALDHIQNDVQVICTDGTVTYPKYVP